MLIFSKEVLIAVCILLKASSREANGDCSSSSSYQVYCIIESDSSKLQKSLEVLRTPTLNLDSLLRGRGGGDIELPDISDKKMEKLVKSIKSKTSETLFKRRSFNKILQLIYQRIEPVITDQRFWKLVSESQKPVKSKFQDFSEDVSTEILNPTQRENEPKRT